MNKAFVRESQQDDEELGEEFEAPSGLPAGSKNYMTARGYAALRTELKHRVERERPDLVQVVAWAASNGDRSENGDYIYGKKRLREIDRRIRFLMKRLETAVVVDPGQQQNVEQVFFGATVTVCDLGGNEAGADQTYQIVGVEEADASSRPDQLGIAAGASAAQSARGRRRARSESGRCARTRGRRHPLSGLRRTACR